MEKLLNKLDKLYGSNDEKQYMYFNEVGDLYKEIQSLCRELLIDADAEDIYNNSRTLLDNGYVVLPGILDEKACLLRVVDRRRVIYG